MTKESLLVSNVQKIAILRSGALGDFIVALPAIQAIRHTYQGAEIVLFGKPWLKEFLEKKRTPVDRFISVPVMDGIREESEVSEDPLEIHNFFSSLENERFDIAIQFQGKGVTANPFIKKLGARLSVGMSCLEAEPLDRAIEYYYYQSEVVRYLEVAGLIGAKMFELEPRVDVLKEDLEEASSFLHVHHLKDYVVLHPYAMDIRRSWPIERFTALADSLIEMGFQVVFSGSVQDEPLISAAISTMKFAAVNSCGELSLGGLSALLSESSLVISSDTGPLHLARAVGAKTVGIYWAPNLINWGPLSRGKHRPVISWVMACPECGVVPNDPYPFEPAGETCNHNLSFVKNVKVEDVLKEAELLLKTSETLNLKSYHG